MIIVGTVLVATSFAAAVLASRPRSAVGKRLARLAPRAHVPERLRSVFVSRELLDSGLGWAAVVLMRAKVVLALVAAAAAASIGLIVPIGFFVVAAAGYVGFIAPTLRVERVAAFRRAEADEAVVALVEWAEFIVELPLPPEAPAPGVARRADGVASGTGERVLVVEDEAAVRSLISTILATSGYAVRTAESSRISTTRLSPNLTAVSISCEFIMKPPSPHTASTRRSG